MKIFHLQDILYVFNKLLFIVPEMLGLIKGFIWTLSMCSCAHDGQEPSPPEARTSALYSTTALVVRRTPTPSLFSSHRVAGVLDF